MTTQPLTVAKIQLISSALTANYRCESCGAQAWVETEIGGHDFYFCAHHYTKQESTLIQIATRIIDHREALYRMER